MNILKTTGPIDNSQLGIEKILPGPHNKDIEFFTEVAHNNPLDAWMMYRPHEELPSEWTYTDFERQTDIILPLMNRIRLSDSVYTSPKRGLQPFVTHLSAERLGSVQRLDFFIPYLHFEGRRILLDAARKIYGSPFELFKDIHDHREWPREERPGCYGHDLFEALDEDFSDSHC